MLIHRIINRRLVFCVSAQPTCQITTSIASDQARWLSEGACLWQMGIVLSLSGYARERERVVGYVVVIILLFLSNQLLSNYLPCHFVVLLPSFWIWAHHPEAVMRWDTLSSHRSVNCNSIKNYLTGNCLKIIKYGSAASWPEIIQLRGISDHTIGNQLK